MLNKIKVAFLILFFLTAGLLAGCVSQKGSLQQGEKKPEKKGEIILYTTTSVYDSGLLDALLPPFEKKYGITVKTVAVGTGEALKNAEKGNADAVFVHDPEKELEYEKRGVLIERTPIAKNFFLIVGPESDSAKVREAKSPEDAFERIFNSKSMFASRGDMSGTHSRELKIWKSIGVDPRKNPGYFETGQGMGETLRVASEKKAYTLSDIATFFSTKNLRLKILFKDGAELENLYSFSLVNHRISKRVNYANAKKLLEYLKSEKAREIIENFGKGKVPEGWQLYVPADNL